MNEYSLSKNAITCSVYVCFVVFISANARIPLCQCRRLNLVNVVCSYASVMRYLSYVTGIAIINFDPLFYVLNMLY